MLKACSSYARPEEASERRDEEASAICQHAHDNAMPPRNERLCELMASYNFSFTVRRLYCQSWSTQVWMVECFLFLVTMCPTTLHRRGYKSNGAFDKSRPLEIENPHRPPGWVILYICHWAKWTLKRHIWTHSRVEPTCKNVHVFACLWEKARTHAGTSRTCKLHSERPQRAGLNPKPPRCVVTALTIAPLWQEAGGEKGKMSASSFSEEQALCSKQLPIPKHAPLTGFESEKS